MAAFSDTPIGYTISTMVHIQRDRKKLLARVRRIAGQVAALEQALEAGDDCDAVLVQIAAAKGAMHGLMLEVMAGHLSDHVVAEPDPTRRADEAGVLLELLKRKRVRVRQDALFGEIAIEPAAGGGEDAPILLDEDEDEGEEVETQSNAELD